MPKYIMVIRKNTWCGIGKNVAQKWMKTNTASEELYNESITNKKGARKETRDYFVETV